MILPQEELRKLTELKHRSPHSILGLHSRTDAPGLVARAMIPHAAKVELRPLGGGNHPAFELHRIHKPSLFEGSTDVASAIFKYELVITDDKGNTRTIRDPYSFLPTLSEEDLYLFGKGDERKLHDKLGAQLRTVDGVAGTSFAVWAPNAQRISVVAPRMSPSDAPESDEPYCSTASFSSWS